MPVQSAFDAIRIQSTSNPIREKSRTYDPGVIIE